MQVKPPVRNWERLNNAAQRIGVPADILRADITAGKADVRMQRMGKRGLVFLASNDVDALQAQLAWGGTQR